jgi:hypothetical protein
MPFIKPGPGQRWCPCCELLFAPAKADQTYCAKPACVAKQAAFKAHAKAVNAARRDERAAAEGCPDCGTKSGRHTPTCPTILFAKPCPVCGRRPNRSLRTGPDAWLRTTLIPSSYLKVHPRTVTGAGPEAYCLLHIRCRDWKGKDRFPRDYAAFQPAWGVKPGVAKVEPKDLPPASTGLRPPLSTSTVLKKK